MFAYYAPSNLSSDYSGYWHLDHYCQIRKAFAAQSQLEHKRSRWRTKRWVSVKSGRLFFRWQVLACSWIRQTEFWSKSLSLTARDPIRNFRRADQRYWPTSQPRCSSRSWMRNHVLEHPDLSSKKKVVRNFRILSQTPATYLLKYQQTRHSNRIRARRRCKSSLLLSRLWVQRFQACFV